MKIWIFQEILRHSELYKFMGFYNQRVRFVNCGGDVDKGLGREELLEETEEERFCGLASGLNGSSSSTEVHDHI